MYSFVKSTQLILRKALPRLSNGCKCLTSANCEEARPPTL
ncbi:hypothetical protein EVA_07148 [gut metagenome]|uniref:Uncharacterized protein n=1 Tax=gut metagenome TaxID=749906 RepID=J9GBP4_9ZZZZ